MNYQKRLIEFEIQLLIFEKIHIRKAYHTALSFDILIQNSVSYFIKVILWKINTCLILI